MKTKRKERVTTVRWDISHVLAAVPGDTLTDKAKAIGVSRQLVHVWARRKSRPGRKFARRLARITGLPASEILGVTTQEGMR